MSSAATVSSCLGWTHGFVRFREEASRRFREASRPRTSNAVPSSGDVKKAIMQMMKADLSPYVVKEWRGSKREMSTVVSKAESQSLRSALKVLLIYTEFKCTLITVNSLRLCLQAFAIFCPG